MQLSMSWSSWLTCLLLGATSLLSAFVTAGLAAGQEGWGVAGKRGRQEGVACVCVYLWPIVHRHVGFSLLSRVVFWVLMLENRLERVEQLASRGSQLPQDAQ